VCGQFFAAMSLVVLHFIPNVARNREVYMRGPLVLKCVKILLLTVCAAGLPTLTMAAQSQAGGSVTKIRLATPTASLSYLPIHVALKKGLFAKRGFDVEVIQMAAGLVAPALLNRAIDYSTIPSGPATAAARGLPLRVICFTSVKLQHVLVGRPEITAVTDLAGKRFGAGSLGTLPAYEVRVLIDRYKLGPGTVIVPLNSSNDRMIATQKGNIDATVVPVPSDLKAEEMGLKRLLPMGSILPIPQAGLATTEEKIKTGRREVIEILKATIEGIDYTWNQREGTIDIIARWMNLNAAQASRVYDSVRDTYSKNGIPSEDQAKAYIAMLSATAGLKGDISANSIFDFSLAAEAAKEMTGK
jgi:NitT/TauT family transport system substrate-binding protein